MNVRPMRLLSSVRRRSDRGELTAVQQMRRQRVNNAARQPNPVL
jgi:hypothetical protein